MASQDFKNSLSGPYYASLGGIYLPTMLPWVGISPYMHLVPYPPGIYMPPSTLLVGVPPCVHASRTPSCRLDCCTYTAVWWQFWPKG